MVSLLRALRTVTHRGTHLPTAVLTSDVTVDMSALAAYDRVCGFRLSDELPATYPHILGFGLQMDLLTRDDFPFPVIGLVHIANRITQHRPLCADERIVLSVRAEDLRPHERGRQFDVVTEAAVDGTPVWQDWSTYLHRPLVGRKSRPQAAGEPGPAAGSGPASAADSTGPAAEHGSPTGDDTGLVADPEPPDAAWRVPADTGRRYAAVSGDANPIHLHPLAARPFGFAGAIAHGMWTKARCLAALEGRLPDSYTVDVRFKLPMLLPAEVEFRSTAARPRPGGDATTFTVRDARTGRPYLSGSLTEVT